MDGTRPDPAAHDPAGDPAGDPVDDEDDRDGPWWAGVLPVEPRFGAPVAAADLPDGVTVPDRVGRLAGAVASGRAGGRSR